MQEIEIEMVGGETSEAGIAGPGDAVSRDLVGLHLGDQKNMVAYTGHRVTQELLGAAVPVVS